MNVRWSRTGLWLVMMACSVCFGVEKSDKGDRLTMGDPLPWVKVADIYGNQIESEKLKGHVVILSILHFGQQKEGKEGDEEKRKAKEFYAVHEKDGLKMIRIAIKKGVPFFISKEFVEGRARETVEKNKEKWTVVIDWEGAIKKILKVEEDPLVFVMDRGGVIRSIRKGTLIMDQSLKELVQGLLKEPVSQKGESPVINRLTE